MAGDLIRVANKQSFTAGAGSNMLLARQVSVLPYTQLTLFVRAHTGTMSSGQSIVFNVWDEAPTEEDPGLDFVGPYLTTSGPGLGTPIANVTIAYPNWTAPALFKSSPVTSGLGGYVRVTYSVTGTVSGVTASVELALKTTG